MSTADDEPVPRVPIVRSLVQFALGLGLFGAIVAFVAPPWDQVAQRVDLALPWLLVGLLGSLLATLVTAARWKLLSEAMGATALPYGVYFHWLALTRVVAQVLPTLVVDVIGRTAALKAAGSRSRMGHLMAPVVLERVLDLVLPIVMLGWAVAVQTDAVGLPPVATLAMTTVLFAVLAVPALAPMAALALGTYARISAWRSARRQASTPERDRPRAPSLSAPTVSRGLATKIVACSIGRYFAVNLQYWGAGAGFGVALPAIVLLSAAPAAMAAGLVGVTPGGLGFQEGGWAAALTQLEVDHASIVVFMAATRLMMAINFGLLAAVSSPWRRLARADPS